MSFSSRLFRVNAAARAGIVAASLLTLLFPALPATAGDDTVREAPVDPLANCNPTKGNNGTPFINTDGAGEPLPATERTMGNTLYTTAGGTGFVLVPVGNDIRSFQLNGTGTPISRGKTSTGLTGDIHQPYQLRQDPLTALDSYQWMYMQETGTGIWAVNGNSLSSNGISASSLSSQVPAAATGLVRLSDGSVVLCALTSSTGGASVNCSYVSRPGQTSIAGNNPTTWVSYYSFPSNWGTSLLRNAQDNGGIDSRLDKYLLMGAPYGTGASPLPYPALVSVEQAASGGSPIPNYFSVAGKPVGFSQISLGKVNGQVYAIANDIQNRRFAIFRIELNAQEGDKVVQVGGYTAWPSSSPNGNTVDIQRASFADENGLVALSDFNSKTFFFYSLYDPANPALIPGIADWWYQNWVSPYSLHIPFEINPIGGDYTWVSANSVAYTTQMSCNLTTSACDFNWTWPSAGKAYPGQSVTFTATASGATSYSWDWGDGQTTGPLGSNVTTHVFNNPGTFTVTLTVQTASGSCQQTKTFTVTTPTFAVNVDPPNAVAGSTTINATNTNTINPGGGYPTYQWKITDQGADATSLAQTQSGGTTMSSWSFRMPIAASDQAGYDVCLTIGFSSAYSLERCAPSKVDVGPNAANFTVPTNPSDATNLTLTDQSLGDIQSFAWQVTGPSGFVFTPTQGNGFGGSTDPRNLVIDKSLLVPCPSAAACYTATLTVGDGPLGTGNIPQGEKSSATKTFTMSGSCKTGSFALSVGGIGVCDSGTTGTTSCGVTGGTCNSSQIYVGNDVGLLPACAQAGTSYFVEWGDGSTESWSTTGSAQGRTHTYNSTGSKTIKLTVNGTYSDILCITVNQQTITCPTANFTYTTSGKTAYFSNTSSNYSTSSWNFGDGSTSTQTSPQHTYANDGNYSVSLTVTQPGCTTGSTSSSITKTVTISSGSSCTSPGTPSPYSPANGATGVDYASGVLHAWNPGSNNATWDLYTYSGSGCTNQTQVYQNLSSASYTVAAGAYAANTTYSWKVVPRNTACTTQTGTASTCFSYTTKSGTTGCTSSPTVPTAVAPAGGATGVANTNVTFQWSDVSTSGCTTTYNLYLYTTACGATKITEFLNLPTNSYTVGSVPENATIFWQVTATNSKGTSSPSSCSFFATSQSQNCTTQAPSQATQVYPPNGYTAVETTGATFSWNAATCATAYDLNIYLGSNCQGAPSTFGYLPDTYYTVGSGLSASTDYSWSVTARNGVGATAGGCSNFRTQGPTTGSPTAAYSVRQGSTPVTGSDLRTGTTYTFDASASTAGSGASLTSWGWNWGDGTASGSGQTATHAFATPGNYSVTLTVTQSDGKSATSQKAFVVSNSSTAGNPVAYLIPAAAHADGEAGSVWQTDIQVFNPDSKALYLKMEFRKSGQDNTNPLSIDLAPVAPFATKLLSDVLLNQYGLSAASGALYFTYSGVTKLPVIQSNTYNVPAGSSGAGTFGQYIPATPLYGTESAQPILLEGIRVTSAFRTNVGIVNLGSTTASYDIELWSDTGQRLAVNSFGIAPYGQVQFPVNRSKFPTMPDSLPSAVIRIVPGPTASLKAYASVVDNGSNDGTYIADVHTQAKSVFLAGSSSAAGTNNTRWGTSVFFTNPHDEQLSLKLTYTPNGANGPFQQVSRRVDLPARGSLISDDIIQSLFGLDGTAGVLQVARFYNDGSTKFPIVSARTYNDAATGTFGQSIPAVSEDGAIGLPLPGGTLYVSGLAKTSAYRTNLGLYNQSPDQLAAFHVQLIDDLGNTLAQKDWQLDPSTGLQQDVFSFMGVSSSFIPSATLIITSTNGQGAVSAYASVVDNLTGDPLFIPATVR